MPALVEIEILRGDLEREVVGRRIKEAEVLPSRNAMKVITRHARRKELSDLLRGAKVVSAARDGRVLVLVLDNDHSIVLALGRGAQLVKAPVSAAPAPQTHLVIGFTVGGQLRLSDPTLTSEVCVVPNEEVDEVVAAKRALVDPLSQPLAWQELLGHLRERDQCMKHLVLDNGFICGLGEIYADEVLFEAGIRYDHNSSRCTSQDARRLYRSLIEILQEALKARGTSAGPYPFKDLNGNPGSYQKDLRVYEREGEMCPRCRHEIQRIEFDSLDTYHCPQCQS